MEGVTYRGSWINNIDGVRYHINFTYQYDKDGNIINEKEVKRIKLR